MNQIKSIQLGVIAICIATVPLSLAQTPRTRTSGSNQTTITTTAAPRYGGSSGNSTRAPQIGINAVGALNNAATTNIGAHTAISAGTRTGISNQAVGIIRAGTGNGVSSGNSTGATQTGINAGSAMNTGANMNAGAHTAINAGVQTGISDQGTGITRAATGIGSSSGNSMGTTQTGINAATGTNTNAGAQAGTAAGAGTGTKTTPPQLPQIILESTPSPNLFTPTPAPTPIPSPSVSPTPSPSV
jgi:hypothetical protein